MAKIYGQLEKAALENLGADVAAGNAGRVWWNTATGLIKFDDGTLVRALLRNDGAAIIGNNGTAGNNIRFHRGASSVLQFVVGSDVTAEGTLSTALAQISFRAENYANTGALPAAGNSGRIAFVTGPSSFYGDTGTTWTPIGTGGASFNDFSLEIFDFIGAVNWTAYADAAGTRPVDMTGGAPTVTITASAVSPLNGTQSGLITKDAANRQGEGVSLLTTLPAKASSQMLSISFCYAKSSGTLAFGSDSTDGDIIFYAYDATNSALVEPIYFKLDGSGLFFTQLQVPAGCTSIRTGFHVASTSASAWVLKFDDYLVSMTPAVYRQPITASRAYASSPTTVASGGFTIINFNGVDWDLTGSITTGGSWNWKAPHAGYFRVSSHIRLENIAWTTGNQAQITVYINGNVDKNLAFFQANASNTFSVGLSGSIDIKCNAGDLVDLRVFQNSGSSVNTGTDNQCVVSISEVSNSELGSEGQVVVARGSFNATRTVTTGAALEVLFDTKSTDSTNSLNTADGRFTAPWSGWYRSSYALSLRVGAATGSSYVTIRVNGSGGAQYGQFQNESFPATGGVYYPCMGTSLIYLNAGDFISVWAAQALTNSYTFEAGEFTIERVSAPSQIPGNAKVYLEYNDNAGGALTANTTNIDFITKVSDSHNAWSGTQFTSPIAQVYDFDMAIQMTAAAGRGLYAYVDGVQKKIINTVVSTANHTCNGSVYLKAGEVLSFRTDTGSTLNAGAVFSWLTIRSQD